MRTRVVLALIATAMILLASLIVLLLVTLRKENPTVAQTIPLEPLSWVGERPPPSPEFVGYDQTVSRCYLDVGSINETVEIVYYHEDSFFLSLNVTVDLTAGYADNINVSAHGYGSSSQLVVAFNEYFVVENLSVLSGGSSSSISFSGVNLPRRASLRIDPRWLMTSPDSQTEQATLTVDITYFNGTAYRKTTCPLNLKSTGCVNTNIENAEEIVHAQTVTNRVLGYPRRSEFYKIHLGEGEQVNTTMVPPLGQNFDLYVYNPSDLANPKYTSRNDGSAPENIAFTADAAGWWFIEVRQRGGSGIYPLEVDDHL